MPVRNTSPLPQVSSAPPGVSSQASHPANVGFFWISWMLADKTINWNSAPRRDPKRSDGWRGRLPLGDLISLPALIPSLADPNAQATFGFVAKCCPATGNLEYNDHQADVRIKAQSVDNLHISSPGTSCPTTPGSHHATFTGMVDRLDHGALHGRCR